MLYGFGCAVGKGSEEQAEQRLHNLDHEVEVAL
jgi:hypothetical protein